MAFEEFVPEDTGTVVNFDEDLDSIPPQHSVPDGEYELRLVAIKLGTSKNNPENEYTMATLEIISDPDSKLISHVIMKAKPSDPERTRKNRLRALGDFHKCFGIPTYGTVNYDEYIGNTGFALLLEQNDPQYGLQNKVRQFVVPK